MCSLKDSASSSSDSHLIPSIKSMPDFYDTPFGSRMNKRPSSDYSSAYQLRSVHQKPLTVVYKTQRTTTGLFKKKTTVVDSGVFLKDSG